VATGVEVRLPQPPPVLDERGKPRAPTAEEVKAMQGDKKLPGYRAALADLRPPAQFVVVTLGKGVDGKQAARLIVAQAPPPDYPPPPPPPPRRR
jgi:hypothetical protein